MSTSRLSPSLFSRLRTLSNRGLDLLFPPTCVSCTRPGSLLCADCAQAVQPVGDSLCARCGRPQTRPMISCHLCADDKNSPLTLTRAAAFHTGPMRAAIHALKYEDQPALAHPLARYLSTIIVRPPWTKLQIDAVVPAPLHAQRLVERGYNQAALLAQHLCAATGLALQSSWLERIEETRQQVGLNREERRANVAGAFIATSAVRGHSLLIIDDVFTTGATMMACAEAARAAGAHAVYGMALALPAHADRPRNAQQPDLHTLGDK